MGIAITVAGAAAVAIYQRHSQKQLEEERDKLKEEKEDVEKTVNQIRDAIKELESAVCGDLDEESIQNALDNLESAALSEKQQMLSKQDRLQTMMRGLKEEVEQEGS